MIRLVWLAVACLMATAPVAQAQDDPYCEDLWFSRNLIFDRAGYCFGSPLGQALFDNANCTTAVPQLPPSLEARVRQIRQIEAQFQCAINTNRTRLTYQDELDDYRGMADVPIRDQGESGCIGYRGAPILLHDGAGDANTVIGQIEPGMSIGFAHWPLDGWDYVSVHPKGFGMDEVTTGWARIGEGLPDCDGYAG